ncbi:MAG: helix-turn-helix transcriptional regulator [Peptostreptococcaceae bacterium]|nr:helix-turn-helix transcriptional regulator [Peptostreptococcaceae bacterium]
MNNNELKITMAAARVNAGLTQSDIAKAMQLSKTTVLSWEKGKVKPKLAQLEMFCRICNINVENIAI